MRTKIITAIYNGLFGTDLGGRAGRNQPYKYSLKTLLQMTQADFVCYTSANEIKELEKFYYDDHKIDRDRIQFKVFDLRDFYLTDKINKLKNLEKTKKSDICFEIQYSKFIWLLDECDDEYDYMYWFDAGLSHNGLIVINYQNSKPDKDGLSNTLVQLYQFINMQ